MLCPVEGDAGEDDAFEPEIGGGEDGALGLGERQASGARVRKWLSEWPSRWAILVRLVPSCILRAQGWAFPDGIVRVGLSCCSPWQVKLVSADRACGPFHAIWWVGQPTRHMQKSLSYTFGSMLPFVHMGYGLQQICDGTFGLLHTRSNPKVQGNRLGTEH